MPKLEKSTNHSHKLISSEEGQATSACKISGHSIHAFTGKCLETSPDGRTDGHAVKWLRLVGWTNGPMYSSKEGISGFGRTDGWTDGRTDGQPENIMPPAPKGGGITTSSSKKWILSYCTIYAECRWKTSETFYMLNCFMWISYNEDLWCCSMVVWILTFKHNLCTIY